MQSKKKGGGWLMTKFNARSANYCSIYAGQNNLHCDDHISIMNEHNSGGAMIRGSMREKSGPVWPREKESALLAADET